MCFWPRRQREALHHLTAHPERSRKKMRKQLFSHSFLNIKYTPFATLPLPPSLPSFLPPPCPGRVNDCRQLLLGKDQFLLSGLIHRWSDTWSAAPRFSSAYVQKRICFTHQQQLNVFLRVRKRGRRYIWLYSYSKCLLWVKKKYI